MKEVFNGFISWDAKFWKTLIPLIIKPGKVSDDFINGKRFRYANPFQFYLSISIVFFLFLGLNMQYEEFKELTEDKSTGKKKSFKIINFGSTDEVENDSIINASKKEIDDGLRNFGVDSIT